MVHERRSHYDVTNTVHIADPAEVCRVVTEMVLRMDPKVDVKPLRDGFEAFTRLYAGILPGYHGCDTWYHDVQHSLDTTLAMARLLDGHERSAAARDRLGTRRVCLGLLCALFHDSGYIRRWDESHFHNGAEFTLYHVSRGGDFLMEFLPGIGFGREADLARRLLHFTGYEIALSKIPIRGRKDRRVGHLLGTADLIAQMADRCYPEKCLRFLFHEFKACGMAGAPVAGVRKPIYLSPDDLINKTPGFVQKLFDERLDGHFEGAYRFLEHHFDGANPYLEQIQRHLDHIARILKATEPPSHLLRRRPRSVNARALRQRLNIRLSETELQRQVAPRGRHRTHARHKPGRVRAANLLPI